MAGGPLVPPVTPSSVHPAACRHAHEVLGDFILPVRPLLRARNSEGRVGGLGGPSILPGVSVSMLGMPSPELGGSSWQARRSERFARRSGIEGRSVEPGTRRVELAGSGARAFCPAFRDRRSEGRGSGPGLGVPDSRAPARNSADGGFSLRRGFQSQDGGVQSQ